MVVFISFHCDEIRIQKDPNLTRTVSPVFSLLYQEACKQKSEDYTQPQLKLLAWDSEVALSGIVLI